MFGWRKKTTSKKKANKMKEKADFFSSNAPGVLEARIFKQKKLFFFCVMGE